MRPSVIAHGDLAFHDPLSPARVDEVLARLPAGASLLDVGCGPGELHRRSGFGGVGLDLDADVIAEARRRAAGVDFRVADTLVEPLPTGFDVVACIGSLHAVPDGFASLVACGRPGGFVLLGDGFWRRTPSAAYLQALGGATEDELTDLPGLLARGSAEYVSVTSDEDWDRYEWTLVANQLAHVAAHPEADDVRASAERARARLSLPEGRDTLGFALVLFRI